ncbi:MAG: cyclic nucleotide-binding domain-containing protein, partial [Burkholderiales bacterium]|nr:cyclic nucleotide-binding domain-containing protein [Burkholderiales bacterium]
FFVGLERGLCNLVCGCARNVRFEQDSYLFRKGEPANEFYLIREGHVALQVNGPTGKPISFQTVGNDEIVGLSWLIPPYRWSFDAKAVARVRAIGIHATCLREKCEADHDLGYELMKRFMSVLIDRLVAARLQALDLYGVPA